MREGEPGADGDVGPKGRRGPIGASVSICITFMFKQKL